VAGCFFFVLRLGMEKVRRFFRRRIVLFVLRLGREKVRRFFRRRIVLFVLRLGREKVRRLGSGVYAYLY